MRVEVTNYSRHAIPDLLAFADRIRAKGLIDAARITGALAETLRISQKFLLPDGGTLLGDSVTESMLPAFHLPYPSTAIEFHVTCSRTDGQVPCSAAHKRIVVGQELPSAPPQYCCGKVPEADSGPGAVVWPIEFIERVGKWAPAPWGYFIPYKQHPRYLDAAEVTRLTTVLKGLGNRHGKLMDFTYETHSVLLGELGAKGQDKLLAQHGADGMRMAMWSDNQLDTAAMIQMCAALKCRNVHPQSVAPPEALQKKAARRGAPPFDTYHILTVDAAGPTGVIEDHARQGGTHASPRTHLRRGHIRRLSDVHFTWVSATVVNPGAAGKTFKTYNVQ